MRTSGCPMSILTIRPALRSSFFLDHIVLLLFLAQSLFDPGHWLAVSSGKCTPIAHRMVPVEGVSADVSTWIGSSTVSIGGCSLPENATKGLGLHAAPKRGAAMHHRWDVPSVVIILLLRYRQKCGHYFYSLIIPTSWYSMARV